AIFGEHFSRALDTDGDLASREITLVEDYAWPFLLVAPEIVDGDASDGNQVFHLRNELALGHAALHEGATLKLDPGRAPNSNRRDCPRRGLVGFDFEKDVLERYRAAVQG